MANQKQNIIERPPVIAIMGHVDHGKSTLLDYIRKTNIVDSEAGGITQKISAYEVSHKGPDGKEHKITFLDTPGHEAFKAIRARGAKVADIAILVVSAEDGVRPQTVEAFQTIQKAGIPFIVAINKIDREGANIDRTKISLAENEIYVEGYGGNVSFVPISAKTGQGIPELLDMVLLTAELEDLKADTEKSASGVVIEANLDKKKGISATLVIKEGTIQSGTFVVAGSAISPVRMMENFLNKPIKDATFSSPIRIIGWSELPSVGSTFMTFDAKKDAEAFVAAQTKTQQKPSMANQSDETAIIPIVIKANEVGGLEALEHELKKIKNDKIKIKIISSGVGDISENDVKGASGRSDTLILGFNTKVDASARAMAERLMITIQTFDIIYKLSEWLEQAVAERTPKTKVEESTGVAKVLKVFSKVKDKQVLGGRVETGLIHVGEEVKIMRRDFEIGRGRVRELQKFKDRVSEVPEGQEFGSMIESKIEIAPGDRLEAFQIVEK
ncbi:MAG: infB [Candidatus Paceibacter sp.]|jgi:translation initiation factor IF-2|nr:infB [Candidatus Paceibacter sp.]